MFKYTSDKEQSLNRTGSHATKPFATGRVEVLPPEAKPWEEVFLSFSEQYKIAASKLDVAFAGVRKCDEKLLTTMPRQDFVATVRHRAQWVEKVTHYRGVCDGLMATAKKAASNSLAGCFLEAAKLVLTDQEFNAVMESAQQLLGDAESRKGIDSYVPPPKLRTLSPSADREQRREMHIALAPNHPRAHRRAERLAKR